MLAYRARKYGGHEGAAVVSWQRFATVLGPSFALLALACAVIAAVIVSVIHR